MSQTRSTIVEVMKEYDIKRPSRNLIRNGRGHEISNTEEVVNGERVEQNYFHP